MNAPTTFAVLPEQDRLAQVRRNLRFHPSTVRDPKILTPEQVAGFNRDGYVKGIRIFDPAQADANRAYFDALLAKVLAAGGNSYSISTAHLKYGKVYDLLTHPRIVACVKDLLGPNVVGWGSHFFCKMPGDGKKVTWHQDAIYWPLTPSKTVTVWLAIDKADRENACMRFIPRTHAEPLPHRPSKEGEDNVLDQTVEQIDSYGSPVDVELEAGCMSMHSDLLLHGSEANMSTRRRCGLTLRYCASEVRAYLDWNLKGVVVAGSDPDKHWANPARPSAD